MNRFTFVKRTVLTIAASIFGGLALTAPSCGVSKEKAVKVTGFVIDLAKEAVPLLNLLNGQDIANLLSTKVLPALEKMKDALSNADIPTSESSLQNVRSVLGTVETALLNFADSPRRTTIIGILATVRILLLTVEAFIDSEMPAPVAASGAMRSASTKQSNAAAIRKAFEVVRQ